MQVETMLQEHLVVLEEVQVIGVVLDRMQEAQEIHLP
tara:strand:- start:307 stop:417 length:111 start_codon:yes stop_codon:yes gene_type:complete